MVAPLFDVNVNLRRPGSNLGRTTIELSHAPRENLEVDDGEARRLRILGVDRKEDSEARIVRKLDWALIPFLTLFYLLSFLDRANISNARVAGLQTDLGLTDTQYQIWVTIFYVPYIAVELPSNLLLRRLGANRVMPTIQTILALGLWSMICALQGSTTKEVAYDSLFMSVSGAYPLPPLLSAWMANNSEPHYRRATRVAFGFAATNSGGILSTWRYPTSESPHYTKTTIMNIVFCCLVVVLSILNVLYLTWTTRDKRRRRDEILAPYLTDISSSTQQRDSSSSASNSEKNARRDYVHETDMEMGRRKGRDDGGERVWTELGDRHPDFVYAI